MGFTEGQNAPSDKFVKFVKIGDTVTGTVQKISRNDKFDKYEVELVINGEPKVVTLSTNLENLFRGTFGSVDKTPIGALVEMTFIETKKTGQPQPMKVFRLRVDTDTLPAGFILNPEPEVDPEIGY